jgi:acetyltransferase-like isoleucine patch superfamily enzyme
MRDIRSLFWALGKLAVRLILAPIAYLCGMLNDLQIIEKIGFVFREFYWKARLKHLGKRPIFYSNVIIHMPQNVVIGNNTSLAEFTHILGGGGVTISDNVLIASHVIIVSQSHDTQSQIMRLSLTAKPVIIEDNVWIGANAIILPGVKIGCGSVIGAGAVVSKDVANNTVVVGLPAHPIRERLSQL